MKNPAQKEMAFTLIELLVVIAIIGILAAGNPPQVGPEKGLFGISGIKSCGRNFP